jgi:hypothetical protein
MRKIVAAVIVAIGFVFAHSVWLAQDVPVTSAADEGTEIATLKAEIDELKGRVVRRPGQELAARAVLPQ